MNSEHIQSTYDRHALTALEALQRDTYLRTLSLEPGSATRLSSAELQTVGRSFSFDDGTEQHLKAVVHAAGVNFNVVATTVDKERAHVITRANEQGRAELVGVIGDDGLVVAGQSQSEGNYGLFNIAYDNDGDLVIANNDRLPIDIAVRRHENQINTHQEVSRGLFGLAGIIKGMGRALRMQRSQQRPKEKAYHDVLQNWAVPAYYIKQALEQDAAGQAVARISREAYVSSKESKKFWEQGSAVHSPDLTDQLSEVRSNPSARTNQMTSTDEALMGTAVLRTKVHFTEREGIEDLDSFLSLAAATAEQRHDNDLLRRATEFREHVRFLGKEEYDKAYKGIARAWAEYVSQSPDHVINVYDNPHAGRRSYTAVLGSIMQEFTNLTEGMPIVSRVQADPDKWALTPHAKLVAVDDWTITRTTLEGLLVQAANLANRKGLTQLVPTLEAHVLLASKDQIKEERTIEYGGQSVPYKLRSYMESSADMKPYEVSMSGAHTSVDYGFEHSLEDMWIDLMKHDVHTAMPLLTHVARTYRDPYKTTIYEPEQESMLTSIAESNAMLINRRQHHAALKYKLAEQRGGQNTDTQEAEMLHVQVQRAGELVYAASDRRLEAIKAYRNSRWYTEAPQR